MSSMLLFSIYQKDKEIEAQIRAANEASIFIAPPDILDPKTIFNDLVAYEDTPAIKDGHPSRPRSTRENSRSKLGHEFH